MWKHDGKEIQENEIYNIVADNYDEDNYEQMLNDNYPEVKIGNLSYSAGYVLKMVDPVAFRVGVSEEVDYIAREIIDNPNDYPEYDLEWEEDEEE